MIDVKEFFEVLKSNDVSFFTGVPDSLLKSFCSYVSDNVARENHIINSNEGSAVALATGHYLSTGKPALVYMQNSGLGNAVNPLLSLADTEVYGIPMILMIGWRGEPGKKDEPQHKKQGRVMLKMLDAMEIPYKIISNTTENFKKIVEDACNSAVERSGPYSIIVSEGTFGEYNLKYEIESGYPVSREEAIKTILDNISKDDIIVSTTGKASREVYEYRESNNQSHQNDFLTVGSMGHCSQIAMGIAMNQKEKKVIVIDGDGALIMHMGALAIAGSDCPDNFIHIILNNGSHESVGGQPTAAFDIDITGIAKACGYKATATATSIDEIKNAVKKMNELQGPSLLEIRINKKSRKNLGRPSNTPIENKNLLMKFLKSSA